MKVDRSFAEYIQNRKRYSDEEIKGQKVFSENTIAKYRKSARILGRYDKKLKAMSLWALVLMVMSLYSIQVFERWLGVLGVERWLLVLTIAISISVIVYSIVSKSYLTEYERLLSKYNLTLEDLKKAGNTVDKIE